jgi:hypothetical protein
VKILALSDTYLEFPDVANLPEADVLVHAGEWAEMFRSDLEFSVTLAGLNSLKELFKRERYEACSSLAERLLEVNPLDVGVNVFLVQATAQLRGALAAREVWTFRANFFKQQIGVVPETLLEMDQSRWNQAD